MTDSDKTSDFVNAVAERNMIIGYASQGGGRICCPMLTLMWQDPSGGGELWTGGTPAYDTSVVSYFGKILCLFPWERYPHVEGTDKVEIEMYDSPSQTFEQVENLSDMVVEWLQEGNKVLVHCQAGLNRSSLISAIAIRKLTGISGEEVVRTMREKRDPNVLCNAAFERYVLDWNHD